MPQSLYPVTGIIAEVGQYPIPSPGEPAIASIDVSFLEHHRPVEILMGRKNAAEVARHLFKRVTITVALADDAEDE